MDRKIQTGCTHSITILKKTNNMTEQKNAASTAVKKPLLDFSGTEPWFKPKRFWKYWAAYYPVSWHGWAITLLLVTSLFLIYITIAVRTSSQIIILARFLPFVCIALLIYDHFSLSRGLYPSWWKNSWRKKKKRKKTV